MTPADPSTVDPAFYGAVAIISICFTVWCIVDSIIAALRRRKREKLSRELLELYRRAEEDSKNNSTK